MVKVKEMYQNAKTRDIKLLSNFSADFWSDYVTNYKKYDALFRRYFLSFHYFLQEDGEDVADITDNFIEDVYNHLLINEKKYSELYRVNVVDDEKYSLYNNYDMVEEMTKDGTADIGAQTSNSSQALGSRTSEHYVTSYDSDTARLDNNDNVGAQSNSAEATSGARHDSNTEEYTLTRVGNIGVMTVTDMIDRHIKLWTKWDFYYYIFSEISRELLLV